MEAGGVQVGELSPAMVERFLIERRQHGYASRISLKGMRPLLSYLDGLGVLPAAAELTPTPVERIRTRTAETVVCALRALLRFLHVQGWIAMPLAEAVPSVPRGGRTCRGGSRLGRSSCCWRVVTARRQSGAGTSRS
jgi:hypothetical protein